MLVATFELFSVKLKCFLLYLLCSVVDVTLWRFLNAIHLTVLSSLDENFLESRTTFMVVKTVDSEYFLAIYICKRKGCFDVIKLILEFALVKKHEHI